MKIRGELHLSSGLSRVILVQKPEETIDHLALKLAAFAMFCAHRPIVEPSSHHPALDRFDHKPDVMILGPAGDIATWIECGSVSTHKLDKILRRLSQVRLIVLKKSLREGNQVRERAIEDIRHEKRIEIWTWPEGLYNSWLSALEEKTEIFGDIQERLFNCVVNHTAYMADLISC